MYGIDYRIVTRGYTLTRVDSDSVVCSNPSGNYSTELAGVGGLTIPTPCQIHSLHKVTHNTLLDIIPENSRHKSESL